jgi:ABC-2 type transport system ATP-binding protein
MAPSEKNDEELMAKEPTSFGGGKRSGEFKAPGSEPLVLVAEDLRKFYGPRLALRGLSFSLCAGRILGFLGPNGAGKTTAIRILTTILEPSAGHFWVNGVKSEDPQEVRRRIGVLPESLGFHKHMTGLECLTFFGRLYGRQADGARTTALGLLRDMGLETRGRSLIGSYSRGMRQRLGIARALVNDPAVLFLDEPTLGLDPRGQQELLELIGSVARDRKVAVVLCSHVLSDIEVVCDDVLIMNLGEVVARGTVAEVIGRTSSAASQQKVVRIHVPPLSVAKAQHVLEGVADVQVVTALGGGGSWLRVELAQGTDAAINNRLLAALTTADVPILGFEAERSRLQDAFLRLTEAARA